MIIDRCVVISGCSSGGKSTMLDALGRRGFDVVEEPGRRIIAEEESCGGTALPWTDPEKFLRRAMDMSIEDLEAQGQAKQWVFFDRGLIDAASGLAQLEGKGLRGEELRGDTVESVVRGAPRYYNTVFLAPPWPEIYVNDAARRHPLSQAREEYQRLLRDYPALGYEVVILPKTSVEERVGFVLQTLGR